MQRDKTAITNFKYVAQVACVQIVLTEFLDTDTLEIFYHAVGILSCRTDNTEDEPSQLGRHHSTRPAFSAQEIIALMDDEIEAPAILLPLVPYAVALSLSVVYRHQHSCVLQTHRIRNEKWLRRGFKALNRLGDIFWSARYIARMVDQILQGGRPSAGDDALQPDPASTMLNTTDVHHGKSFITDEFVCYANPPMS